MFLFFKTWVDFIEDVFDLLFSKTFTVGSIEVSFGAFFIALLMTAIVIVVFWRGARV